MTEGTDAEVRVRRCRSSVSSRSVASWSKKP